MSDVTETDLLSLFRAHKQVLLPLASFAGARDEQVNSFDTGNSAEVAVVVKDGFVDYRYLDYLMYEVARDLASRACRPVVLEAPPAPRDDVVNDAMDLATATAWVERYEGQLAECQ